MIKKILLLACSLWLTAQTFSQTTILGNIKSNHNKPISNASISIKDTYDGATTDSTGKFSFTTTEKGEHILQVSCVGYKSYEQKITLADTSINININLKEEPNELTAVVISAGSFEAGDKKRTTILNSLDIVTTAGSNGDITGAIKTLPGTQQVGNQEGLFVRGGTNAETKQFIDGTLVNNPYYTTVPDIAQRGRFSPFLFKGTVFTSGGYSALYGQALSAALILESIDLPDRSAANVGLSTVGPSAGFQQLSKNKKSSWGVNYGYFNLTPYFKIVSQKPDYFTAPTYHNADANFRVKTSKTGMLKFYTSFATNTLGLRFKDIDSINLKDAFGLTNYNVYTNASYHEKISRHWRMDLSAGFSYNLDKINQELQDVNNQKQTISTYPFQTKNFNLHSTSTLSQIKLVLENKLRGLSALRFGGEYLYSQDKSEFNTFNNIFNDHFSSIFAEGDFYITNDIAAKVGARLEYSSILQKINIAPRISLAYKLNSGGQFSFAYGDFYQKPERQYLLFTHNLNYSKATHYILNYQKITTLRTFRVEAFHKRYYDLIKTYPDTNNLGNGYAQGIELFWRDKQTIKNLDYWISYSYLDTKRNYLNFSNQIEPNFAAKHTASLVVKRFVEKIKTGFNLSYTFATGRPYYDIRYDSTNSKFAICDQGRTIPYHSVSFSLNYLTSLFHKKDFSVLVFSLTNVFGNDQIYGYNYSYNGLIKSAITPPARRFFFIGLFMSFGVDRTQDVINNNL